MNPILKYLKHIFASKRVLGDDAELNGLAKADFLLRQLITGGRVPGISVTVLKEGKTFFQKGYGYADVERKRLVDPRKSIFRIASVSKPIAATALAHMVQEGLINLDSTFYSYVPDYPKKRWDFSIRELAGHTAGIRVYKGKEYGLNEALTIKHSLNIFKNDPLVFVPGEDVLYTSFDWVMISAAMQEASGIPFEIYVQDKVLNPLGMTNTYVPKRYSEPSERSSMVQVNEITATLEKNKVVTFYSKCLASFRKAIPVDNFYKLAGGGYLSTSEDIAKFGQAYLDKKIGVKEKILNQFATTQHIHGKPTYYGLGWQVSEDAKGRAFFGHVGNGVGGYSNFFVYPQHQMVVSILINCTDPKIQPALDDIIDCFHQLQ